MGLLWADSSSRGVHPSVGCLIEFDLGTSTMGRPRQELDRSATQNNRSIYYRGLSSALMTRCYTKYE